MMGSDVGYTNSTEQYMSFGIEFINFIVQPSAPDNDDATTAMLNCGYIVISFLF